jgi:hypothetical protein
MAITRQTTNCAGNARLRDSDTFVLAMPQGGLPVRARLFDCLCWYSCLNSFEYVTTLYIRRQQREILQMHHTQFPFLGTMLTLHHSET